MELGFELNTRQEQRLIMTPELRQSLKILQISSQELSDYVRLEMERNPLLEAVDEIGTKNDRPAVEQYPMDWKEYFKSLSGGNRGLDDPVYREEENDYTYEYALEDEKTLYEHLMLQLEVSNLSDKDRSIAAFIIRQIDDNGYLTVTKHELAAVLNISKETAGIVLKTVQSFDPPGVGARSLRECLLLQLKRRQLLTQELKTVVLEHLRDIAANHYPIIAKNLGCSIESVQQMCDLIKTLEPKPGRPFIGTSAVRYIVPDIEVEKADDEYVIQMREYCAPRLTINKVYRDMLSNNQVEPDVVQFLVDRLQSAHRLMKSIEQRKMTIQKIVASIVHYQQEFLDNGILSLKPMTLRMVAEDTGLHESTVSRAVSEKYVQTPRGVFELKFFFDHGVTSLSGKSVSSQCIKQLIHDAVQQEDVLKPYSDTAITELLAQKDIDVSRRTVAKYRDELGIPNSSRRKRF